MHRINGTECVKSLTFRESGQRIGDDKFGSSLKFVVIFGGPSLNSTLEGDYQASQVFK